MILQPAIVSLLLASALVTTMVLYAAFFGVRILRQWDISSGSDSQLALERRTYLISSLLAWAFVLQITSLFLLVYTADDLHSRFIGAMCAAGTLNVNGYGYPAFVLKIVVCILAGLWLLMNHADNRAYDYPLQRTKFILLLVIVPFAVAELVLQTAYFLAMQPNIITSCCGSLFSADAGSISGDLLAVPPGPMMVLLWATLATLLATGFVFLKKNRAGRLFSLFAVLAFPVGVAALLSFIALYFYELPSHHCPFCILKKEYGYVGYAFYTTLIGGVICGGGVGILQPFQRVKSLSRIIPDLTRHLAAAAMACYALFGLIAGWRIVTADLILGVL